MPRSAAASVERMTCMPVTVTHDPETGITATATTGAINWAAIIKAILAALVAALGA